MERAWGAAEKAALAPRLLVVTGSDKTQSTMAVNMNTTAQAHLSTG